MTEPKIRFLKEDGNYFPKWETTFIGEIVERQEHPVKVDKEVEYREIGIRSHGKGIFHKDPVTGKELGNKRVFDIVPDCLVLNIVFAWERAVAKTTTDEVGMIASHRFPMYKPKDGILDLDYIVRYLISDKGKKILELASPGGAGRNRTLGQKAFMESELPLPCYEEQEKIAEFFDKIDDVISNVEKELEAYIRLKAGMLQKMFPRNGSRVPEVRFPGFTEDWEQRKFSDVVEIGSGMDYKHLDEGDIPVYGTGGYMLSVDAALSEDKDAIGIGRKGTIDKPYILRAPFWTVDTLFYCIPKENHDLDFTNCLFQNVDWKKKDESTGVPSLSKVIINNVETAVPSYGEQKKIGEYFKSIDNLITLQQRELDIWNKMKTGYLQRMFI